LAGLTFPFLGPGSGSLGLLPLIASLRHREASFSFFRGRPMYAFLPSSVLPVQQFLVASGSGYLHLVSDAIHDLERTSGCFGSHQLLLGLPESAFEGTHVLPVLVYRLSNDLALGSLSPAFVGLASFTGVSMCFISVVVEFG
jgi:hypothetical protein